MLWITVVWAVTAWTVCWAVVLTYQLPEEVQVQLFMLCRTWPEQTMHSCIDLTSVLSLAFYTVLYKT